MHKWTRNKRHDDGTHNASVFMSVKHLMRTLMCVDIFEECHTESFGWLTITEYSMTVVQYTCGVDQHFSVVVHRKAETEEKRAKRRKEKVEETEEKKKKKRTNDRTNATHT